MPAATFVGAIAGGRPLCLRMHRLGSPARAHAWFAPFRIARSLPASMGDAASHALNPEAPARDFAGGCDGTLIGRISGHPA